MTMEGIKCLKGIEKGEKRTVVDENKRFQLDDAFGAFLMLAQRLVLLTGAILD